MYMKSKRLTAWCLVVSLIMCQIIFGNTVFAASTAQKNRLYGADRIQTAIEISRAGWTSTSDYAVLVTANNFPDALCAAPLAKLYNAPLLLTDSNVLNASVKSELQRLKVKNVIIVGGPGVVSDGVFNAVREFASVQRISGSDRESTSVEVAKRLGSPKAAVLATGMDFPDALSISSIAAAKGMPILLTGRDVLNANVEKYLKDYGITTTYIVGGTGAIGSSVEARVPGPVRLAGSDRIQTNFEILSRFANELNFSKVYIATARDFPDALSGSALAAMTSSPIVLADGTVLASIKNLIKNNVQTATEIVGLGGTAVVSDYIVDDVVSNINGQAVVTPGAFGVQSVTAVNRNYIEVVFTDNVDKASAENHQNYMLNGVPLFSSSDKIVLKPDRRTVCITLDTPMEQMASRLFSIKENAIFSENFTKAAGKFERVLSFSDAQVPYVKSVSAESDKLVTIEFSEPVKMPSNFIAALETSIKINGQFLANYGFNNARVVEPTLVNVYSNKLELSFSTGLPMGSYTITIPEGNLEYLVDSSNFMVARTDVAFTVSSVSNAPKIVSVSGQTNGTVFVTYDRAMDPATAEGEFLYSIGTSYAMAADFVPGSGNKVVRLVFGSGVVRSGANVLTVDKDIKDTSGNVLNSKEDLNIALNAVEDKEKPTVVSVHMTGDKHIRIKFSEPMDISYATEKSNYTLMDPDGLAVSYISSISAEGGSYSDLYTITLNTSISGAGYKLRIRNLQDRATPANTMDEYETSVSGVDNVAPTLVEVVVPDYSSSQVVILFSEAMSPETLTNRSNFSLKGGDDSFHELPSSAQLDVGADKKSVTITFPTGYTVSPGGGISQYHVKGIRVANVKDAAGNLLSDVVAYKDVVNAQNATSKPTYVKNSFMLFENGENIRAEFEMSQTLAILRINDFRVGGYTADSGQISGRKIILNFTDPEKVKNIRMGGPNITLYTAYTDSSNIAGTRIAYISGEKVYDDRLAPRLLSVTAKSGGDDTITMKFSEKLDDGIPGLYTDDFTFLGGGSALNVISVSVSYDTIIYRFNSNSFEPGDRIIVKAVEKNASIRDLKDEAGDQNIYNPSYNDVSGITVTAE